MKKSSIFLIVFLLVSSCNFVSHESDNNLSVKIDSLKNENDSLKAELIYVAQINEKIYQEREAVKEELNTLKKRYNIRPSDGNPLSKYNLKLTRSKTGFMYSNYDALFLPAITLEFKNIANIDLTERVFFKYIFIDKATGEQIYEGTEILSDSFKPLAGGLVKQINKRTDVGWSAVKDQQISVRVYIRDTFWKEFKIDNNSYEGRI